MKCVLALESFLQAIKKPRAIPWLQQECILIYDNSTMKFLILILPRMVKNGLRFFPCYSLAYYLITVELKDKSTHQSIRELEVDGIDHAWIFKPKSEAAYGQGDEA